MEEIKPAPKKAKKKKITSSESSMEVPAKPKKPRHYALIAKELPPPSSESSLEIPKRTPAKYQLLDKKSSSSSESPLEVSTPKRPSMYALLDKKKSSPSSSSSESSLDIPEDTPAKYQLLDKPPVSLTSPLPLTSSTDSSIEVPEWTPPKYELLGKKKSSSKRTEDPTIIVIEKDIVKKDTKAAKSEVLTKKGSTLLEKAAGEVEEKHVEVRLEVSHSHQL